MAQPATILFPRTAKDCYLDYAFESPSQRIFNPKLSHLPYMVASAFSAEMMI